MRRAIPALLCALATLLLRADVREAGLPSRVAIRAVPIPLDLDDPRRRDVGALRFVAGWELRGADPSFGGISAMAIAGDRFLLLSDEGRLASFRFGPDGVPRDPLLRSVPGMPPSRDPHERDTESLTRDPVTGRSWIGTEGVPTILRLDPHGVRVEARRRPAAMRGWPLNGGAETLVRLRDGRFLTIGEEAQGGTPDTRAALLFAGDPTLPGPPPLHFAYRPPAGFVPTDAAELPDGRVLVLNRHFAWRDGFAAAVTVFPEAAMRAGATIRAQEIARLRRPLATDNMEAIAVTREGSGTIIWIASDDNLTLLQRTLLLKFRLSDGAGG